MSDAVTPASAIKLDGLVIDTAEMLVEERAALGLGDAQGTALCLSGGGVRSAAFCLGVLQVLGCRSLLHQFTYLSTVSGGGYTGGFLRRAIAQAEVMQDDVNVSPEKRLETVLQRILHVIDSKGDDAG